jgi:hypothetical protein
VSLTTRCYDLIVNDRARIEQYIEETAAEIATMKAVVVRGVANLRSEVRSSRAVNVAFRRVIELGPQLSRAQARLAALTSDGASQLSLRRQGNGYTNEPVPPNWGAQVVPEGDAWVMIVKRHDERLWSYKFATPFDALSALQSEIDPTMCLVREVVETVRR